jgi:hypothetical protein
MSAAGRCAWSGKVLEPERAEGGVRQSADTVCASKLYSSFSPTVTVAAVGQPIAAARPNCRAARRTGTLRGWTAMTKLFVMHCGRNHIVTIWTCAGRSSLRPVWVV